MTAPKGMEKTEKESNMKGIVCMTTAMCACALAAYPAPWGVDASTPEKRAAIIEKFWKHDASADTVLWPEGKVPMQVSQKPFKFLEHELGQSNVVITDINVPQFTFFPAKGEGAKAVVVILPGGGYAQLGWNKEGTEIADWLNANGVSAAVLLYRAPHQRDAALCDVQRTIGLLRRDAKKYGIDPGKVGVIGFSAGANLAVRAATNWRTRRYERVDDADDFSCRPDFQLPIYPWDLLPKPGKGSAYTLKADYPVDRETPPAFIAQAQDDFCQIETSLAYYQALRNADVKSELHVYPSGGHGYGLRRLGTPCDAWSDAAALWLKNVLR